jgi:hypothetical protein
MSTACITGASSGIGREFATALSKMGFDLILVARNKEALDKLADSLHTKCTVITCDLSDEKQCLSLGDKLASMNIHILINNAGFGDLDRFCDADLQKSLEMINVNVKALHILTSKVLPSFVKRDKGYILNVASCAGLFPGGPYMSAYYAGKAYVVSLTGAIYQELKEQHSNVHISMLCPGPVNTSFNETANVAFALPGISAKRCVSYCLSQMKKGKLMIVPSLSIKLSVFAVRFVPRKVMLAMTAKQQKKKR